MKKALTVEVGRSRSTGAVVYKIKKPGYQHDLLLDEQQIKQPRSELERIGVQPIHQVIKEMKE